MNRKFSLVTSLAALALVSFVACSTQNLPSYEKEPVVEITADGEKLQGTGADACTKAISCERTGAFCTGLKGGPIDIITEGGKVVSVLCYTSKGESEGVTLVPKDGKIGEVKGNKKVVTFDPATDGKPLQGDVKIEGNNNVLYGNGPGSTILDGAVTLTGNNGRVRGVRIQDNLLLQGNNQGVVHTIVDGDLTIEGNNSVLADVIIHGKLILKGNNHILLDVLVGGGHTFEGKGYECTAVSDFEDKDKDGVIAKAEIGKEIPCP